MTKRKCIQYFPNSLSNLKTPQPRKPTVNKTQTKTLITLIMSSFISSFTMVTEASNGFTLNKNGKTISCQEASILSSGDLNGITYTKINNVNQLASRGGSIKDSNACTTGITDMSGWYKNNTDFNENISHWDTSSVTNFSAMFWKANNFTQDLSNWDTSKAVSIKYMLMEAYQWNSDLSNWNLANLKNMTAAFAKTSFTGSGVANWNVSNVTNFSYAFYGSKFSGEVSKWNTASAYNMQGMFWNAKQLNSDIGRWNVSNVTNFDHMLRNTSTLDQNLSGWCVEKINQPPTKFSSGSGISNKSYLPAWGSCPDELPEPVSETSLTAQPTTSEKTSSETDSTNNSTTDRNTTTTTNTEQVVNYEFDDSGYVKRKTISGYEAELKRVPENINDKLRFLRQASFGAKSIDQAEAIQDFELWIDEQIKMEPTTDYFVGAKKWNDDLGKKYYKSEARHSYFRHAALNNPDQLRQRMGYALSQLFVISEIEPGFYSKQLAVGHYQQTLFNSAFSNFRDILNKVTYHPMMGNYLTYIGSRKESPDENYARELMQLFTIGLTELNLDGSIIYDNNGIAIPTYNTDTIKNYASIFTGFQWNGATGRYTPYSERSWTKPMTIINIDNESNTERKILGGITISDGVGGHNAVKAALDSLFYHPNLPPFIADFLIKRFVMSNPSSNYIARVAKTFQENEKGIRGDLGSVIKAVLLDPEARGKEPLSNVLAGKIEEPMLKSYRAMRALNVGWAKGQALDNPKDIYNQGSISAPNVFNFYEKTFTPPNTAISERRMVAPEIKLMTPEWMKKTSELLASISIEATPSSGDGYRPITTDFYEKFDQETNFDSYEFIEEMNLLLLEGRMNSDMKDILNEYASEMSNTYSNSTIAKEIVYMILVSPEYAVAL